MLAVLVTRKCSPRWSLVKELDASAAAVAAATCFLGGARSTNSYYPSPLSWLSCGPLVTGWVKLGLSLRKFDLGWVGETQSVGGQKFLKTCH